MTTLNDLYLVQHDSITEIKALRDFEDEITWEEMVLHNGGALLGIIQGGNVPFNALLVHPEIHERFSKFSPDEVRLLETHFEDLVAMELLAQGRYSSPSLDAQGDDIRWKMVPGLYSSYLGEKNLNPELEVVWYAYCANLRHPMFESPAS